MRVSGVGQLDAEGMVEQRRQRKRGSKLEQQTDKEQDEAGKLEHLETGNLRHR